jgi:UDP-GlcNAc:undecaprenyl-phosphate/decaprenyl-phosphate GlcNAc-1-phosphate transferase
VLVLYAVSIVLGVAALVLTYASSSQAMYFLLALSGVAFLALRRLGYLDLAGAQQALAGRKRNLETRSAVRRVGSALRLAKRETDVWVGIRVAASSLGACAVALHLPEDPAREDAYSDGFPGARSGLFRARYGILPERPGDTHIELGWDDGRTAIDRDTEIAIELLCDHVAAALERVSRIDPVVEEPAFARAANE